MLAIRAAVGTSTPMIASKLAPTISPYPATKQPDMRTCLHKPARVSGCHCSGFPVSYLEVLGESNNALRAQCGALCTPFGRAVKRPSAALRSLELARLVQRSRALHLHASRSAERVVKRQYKKVSN